MKKGCLEWNRSDITLLDLYTFVYLIRHVTAIFLKTFLKHSIHFFIHSSMFFIHLHYSD